ncbi:helix-turn-helix domain-containing protein [Sulfurovum lithotrophicum]|nr:helix-turn-helix domain-containing protein [Sulfurovum lithotrophicum]
METSKLWLTPTELQAEFKISKSSQAKYRMLKKIPFSKIGAKYIRYNRDDIHQWLNEHKVEVAS